MGYKINILHGDIICMDEVNNRTLATLKTKNGRFLDYKNLDSPEAVWIVYGHIDFIATDMHLDVMKTMAMRMVKVHIERFYNRNMLFNSNPHFPNRIYKTLSNVKGKDISLKPMFDLI